MKEVLSEDKGLYGCMVGRAANENPWILGAVDKEFYGVANPGLSRKEVVLKYAEYIDKEMHGRYCARVKINPVLNLFYAEDSADLYYNFLVEGARNGKYDNDVKQLLEDAISMYSEHNVTALNKIHD
eukprot:TRINITY_DN12842_c0_g1_i3.p4 TRINITY_DN12842_c0_g1~~TRINITY_DN12842_c0_g1_i3.p4  ORF type:complete len:127 (+),score=28.50 TRINITY_DN12842_c0_g1_i3:578-958(+)